jgi:hypothetical protein
MTSGAKYPLLQATGILTKAPTTWVCWACRTKQSTSPGYAEFTAFGITIFQCLECLECKIVGTQREYVVIQGRYAGQAKDKALNLHPGPRPRPARNFRFVHPEVMKSYTEACSLFGAHAGAAGAFARRTLELLLEHAGYAKPTLDQSIKAAEKETDADRKLPARLLSSLGYIREAGNFAVHVRRDQGLIILDITREEVSACLEVVEELTDHLFEQPAEQFQRMEKLNEKLVAAGKTPLPLPTLLYSPPPNAGDET